jgi:hypothetical protein
MHTCPDQTGWVFADCTPVRSVSRVTLAELLHGKKDLAGFWIFKVSKITALVQESLCSTVGEEKH